MSKYNIGVFCGRFQIFHKGHERIVEAGLENCNKLVILIGSAQAKGTERNPFSIETRLKMIQSIYGDNPKIIIKTIPDLSTEDDISPEWGEYFLNHIQKEIGTLPDVLVYGEEKERKKWFKKDQLKGIDEIIIKRNEFSATAARKYLIEGNKEKWMQCVNPKIHFMWDELRRELLNVKETILGMYKKMFKECEKNGL